MSDRSNVQSRSHRNVRKFAQKQVSWLVLVYIHGSVQLRLRIDTIVYVYNLLQVFRLGEAVQKEKRSVKRKRREGSRN